MGNVTVIDHPLVQHKLSYLRDTETGSKEFRELVSELAMLLTYEATRDLPLEETTVHTPVADAKCYVLAGKKLGIVPILRAGLGMVEGINVVKRAGCKNIKLVCLIAAPEGIEVVQKAHPDVDIFVASIDECLNDHGYIVPGLGDAGDRLFGTK